MTDEETLHELYAQRQEIFKQLTEIDLRIKNLETLLEEKRSASQIPVPVLDECTEGRDNAAAVSKIIALSVTDAAGLREGIKTLELCKVIQEDKGSNGNFRGESWMRFRNALFREAIARAVDLSRTPQGSDFMLKVISLLQGKENGREESEFILIINSIGDKMAPLCCDTNAARVIQKLVDCCTAVEEIGKLVDTIAGSLVTLAKDINGNHVLGKLLAKTANPLDSAAYNKINRTIYLQLSEHCFDICRNRQGCCVIQKCIQLAPSPYREDFIQLILNSALKLVQDPFGNYVVQYILDNEDENPLKCTNQIIRQLLHHVAELSCNKFGSNVIEKCFRSASEDVCQLMVDEITDPQVLPTLLTDNFANYVVQTAIATSNDAQLQQLRDAIAPLQGLLKNSPYGVKIEAKLLKRHREAMRRNCGRKGPPNGSGRMRQPRQEYRNVGNSHFVSSMPFQAFVADSSLVPAMYANMQPDLSLYPPPQLPLMLSNQPPVIRFEHTAAPNPHHPPLAAVNVLDPNSMGD